MEFIDSDQLQIHLDSLTKKSNKKRKCPSTSSSSSAATKSKPKTVVRPGCKKSKLTSEDKSSTQNEEDLRDLRLLNYPTVDKLITPIVSTVLSEDKPQLVIDFNRPPCEDERFRFIGYSMVFLSRAVKDLATSLTLASNILKQIVPLSFGEDGIRIKKREYAKQAQEDFIFQVHFHHLLQYYCHVPMVFSLTTKYAQYFAKRHSNQSGEVSAVWTYRRDDKISVQILNDAKNVHKKYAIPVGRSPEPLIYTAPLDEETEFSWNMELEELSRACDELDNGMVKNPSMTFRLWGNAIEIFSENESNFHVFGMQPNQLPVKENLQLVFHVSLLVLRMVCSRMKKSRGQEKTLTISVDANPVSFVEFSQNISDQISLQWWLLKRVVRS